MAHFGQARRLDGISRADARAFKTALGSESFERIRGQVDRQAKPPRRRGKEATREAALLRLRPIMMTALVACLGLLPAALATGIGSDTQKPFASVIVAGLISRLFIGFFVNPVLYQMVAREGDVIQV